MRKFEAGALDPVDEFLSQATAVVPYRDVAAGRHGPKVIGLRHDIDDDFGASLKMARWEALRGYRASYYVLPGRHYYDTDAMFEGMREMVALGHEIGLHLNVIRDAWSPRDKVIDGLPPAKTLDRAAVLLRQQLSHLRNSGFEIVGAAGHGDGRVLAAGTTNMAIFEGGYTPADFDLTYEAYALQHAHGTCISDNGGRWHEPLAWQTGQTFMLMHPQHWVDAL